MLMSDRFWMKVATGDGCWEWRAARDKDGYGVFKLNRKMVKAHRYAYEALIGPIPEGMGLDHLCRNRGCCNPKHLEPVPSSTNIRRGLKAKIDSDTVEVIRSRYAIGDISQRALAEHHGLSQAQISHIVTGRRWK